MLDVGALTSRPRFAEHSRETFDAVLDLAEQVATRHFAPHNRAADLAEPRFDGERVHMIPEVAQALGVFAGTGIVGAAMDESVGGMQLPQAVAQACFLWFQAANVGTAAYHFLTIANANLLLAHGRYACPSRRRDPRSPTSPREPNPATTAPTACREQDVDLRWRSRPE